MWARPKRRRLAKRPKLAKNAFPLPDDLWGLIFMFYTDSLGAWGLVQAVNRQSRRCALKSRALACLPVVLPKASRLERLGSTLPGINTLMLEHVDGGDLPLCAANLTAVQHLSLALPDRPDTYWRPRPDVDMHTLSAMCSLTTLQSLQLDGCLYVSDVTHLARLTSLRELSLKHCPVIDLGPLTPLRLRKLTLDQNPSLTNLSPLSRMCTLRHLSLQRCELLPDEALESLVGLKQLRTLNLSFCAALSAAGLCTLSKLTGLKELDFTGTRLDDTVMRVLCQSLQLEELQLCACDITDTSLRDLASQTALRRLNLEGCRNLADLTPLATIVSLLELGLSNCYEISDQNLKPLSALVHLQKLDLQSTDVTQACLSFLRPLTSLQVLDIDPDTPITDAGLQAIGPMTSLQELVLCKTVSDDGLRAMSRLTGIQRLDLSGCNVTDKGLWTLTSLSVLHTIDLSSLPITDAGLTALAQLQSLTSVDLSRCHRITAGGVWELQTLCLQTLKLAECVNMYPPAFGLPPFARLKELDLRQTGIHQLDASLFTASLETLDVSSCTAYWFKELSPQPFQPALRALRMSRWGPLWPLDLRPLAHLTRLQSLDLSHSVQVADGHVRVLAPFPLVSLNLSHCDAITDDSLRALASSRTLTELDVSECDLVTDAGLQFLSGSKLKRLNCSSCDRVTAVGVNAVLGKVKLCADDCLGIKDCFARILPRSAPSHHPAENHLLYLSMLSLALRTKSEQWFTIEAVEDRVALFVGPRLVEATAMYVNVEFEEADWEFISAQFSDPVHNVHRRWYLFQERGPMRSLMRSRIRVHARPLVL